MKKGLIAVKKLKRILPRNYNLVDLALKWILKHDEVSVVIPGATNEIQVDMNTKAPELRELSNLYPKIENIYNNLIKPYVHHRW